MTTAQLKLSKALWKRREDYRRKKLTFYRTKSKRPEKERKRLVVKWSNLVSEARNMVARRERQLASRVGLAERAYLQAKKYVGVMEVGGNNQGAMVMRIIRANAGTGPEPWCGDFMAFVYLLAESKVVQRGWAAVRFIGFLTGMKITSSPVRGDMVCFTFDHVGMFVAWCDSRGNVVPKSRATHIKTIEGNTGASGAVSDSSTGGDGVYVKIRHRSLVSRFVHVLR